MKDGISISINPFDLDLSERFVRDGKSRSISNYHISMTIKSKLVIELNGKTYEKEISNTIQFNDLEFVNDCAKLSWLNENKDKING